jgi:hypothetical protein
MKSDVGKPARKKTMRVATALTGVTACATVFAPTQAARAASTPAQPYTLLVDIQAVVSKIQVCGYKSPAPGRWTCTAVEPNPKYLKESSSAYMGNGWRRGKINVWLWDKVATPSKGGWTCNTNGAYHGWVNDGNRVHLSTGMGVGFSAALWVPTSVREC